MKTSTFLELFRLKTTPLGAVKVDREKPIIKQLPWKYLSLCTEPTAISLLQGQWFMR